MTDAQIVEVVKAHESGAIIEDRCKDDPDARWFVTTNPSWNFGLSDYRVKPDHPEEWWVCCDYIDFTGVPMGNIRSYGTRQINHHRKQVHVREVLD